MPEIGSGAPIDDQPVEDQPRSRGWFSRRWVVVVVYSAIALAAGAMTMLVPALQESRVAYGLDKATDEALLWLFVLQAVLVAPVVETGVLAILVFLMRRMRFPSPGIVLIASGLLALMHQSYVGEAVSTLPVMIVFVSLYVSRTTAPFEDGFALTTLVHTINNLVPSISLLAYRYSLAT